MFANRYFILLGSAALMLVILLSFQQVLARSIAVSDMDSATQSYSAWAKAAEVEGIDSATRSYRAWALEVVGAAIPRTGNAESPGYYQRHPEWTSSSQNIGVPVTSISEYFDYYQRHAAEQHVALVESAKPTSPIDECFDVSLSDVAACREASQ